eukprot:gene23031-biopygen23792
MRPQEFQTRGNPCTCVLWFVPQRGKKSCGSRGSESNATYPDTAAKCPPQAVRKLRALAPPLQQKGLLPGSRWDLVAAQPTYNPPRLLGRGTGWWTGSWGQHAMRGVESFFGVHWGSLGFESTLSWSAIEVQWSAGVPMCSLSVPRNVLQCAVEFRRNPVKIKMFTSRSVAFVYGKPPGDAAASVHIPARPALWVRTGRSWVWSGLAEFGLVGVSGEVLMRMARREDTGRKDRAPYWRKACLSGLLRPAPPCTTPPLGLPSPRRSCSLVSTAPGWGAKGMTSMRITKSKENVWIVKKTNNPEQNYSSRPHCTFLCSVVAVLCPGRTFPMPTVPYFPVGSGHPRFRFPRARAVSAPRGPMFASAPEPANCEVALGEGRGASQCTSTWRQDFERRQLSMRIKGRGVIPGWIGSTKVVNKGSGVIPGCIGSTKAHYTPHCATLHCTALHHTAPHCAAPVNHFVAPGGAPAETARSRVGNRS